ncbi:GGDEF domain-containing protein [Actinoplanes derwentensis]|uniref:Diguanylate cyclase (GGDEF) domain-containing protein n=1 Tax=Actinoplanes derwentensis TaxID=113562 RepID=A0A1H1R3N9_9ACTN|nr:GGDEF domain-containing protein [Actinoplanes derwentensis]SDS30250.1 diguanylate cyclase (GGDEF) domain-containing protein [Actinoplanes derwentensis]
MTAFLVVALACTAAIPVIAAEDRHPLFVIVALFDLVAVLMVVRRAPRGDRTPFVHLTFGVLWLLVNIVLAWIGGDTVIMVADLVLVASNLHLLAGAVTLVLRRARGDVGGLVDAAVMAIVLCALIWTVLLQPGLNAASVALLQQTNLLASILLLSGVLGALIRAVRLSASRPAALTLLAAAVLCDLVAYIFSITATGTVTTQTALPVNDMFFMAGYGLLGLAALHPSAPLLARPGPVPPDRLRVVLLTAAVTVVPTVAGVRDILGVRSDAALLTVGNLLIVGLVAFRVARLGRQREAAELRLRHQATHDLLTGLPNRAELWHRLDAALSREQQSGRPAVVLLFCDLNGFKQVNDRLGHLAGDLLLTEVATRFRAGLTGSDVVTRYGGDEFVLISEDEDQQAAADRLTAHIRAALNRPIPLGGEDIRVGTSIGAVLSDGRRDADDLIRHADQAMYDEKALRRAA